MEHDQRATMTDIAQQCFLWEHFVERGQQAIRRQDYHEAAKMLTIAVERSQRFARKDVRRAQSLRWLALVYIKLNEFRLAEKLYDQLLELAKKQFGPDSPEMMGTLEEMTDIYQKQNKIFEIPSS